MNALWQRLGRIWKQTPDSDWSLQDRLVVVDTETTGLNTRRDALLSIGAVAITRGRIQLNDSFYQLLQSETRPSGDNVLVHRLTPSEIHRAAAPEQAIEAFLDYVRDAPLLAYHADFDRAILNRACKLAGLPAPQQPFIDIAHWVLMAHPGLGNKPMTLEAATAYFRIHNASRHNAHSDALTTALLALKLLQHDAPDRPASVQELQTRIKNNHRLRSLRH